MFNLRKLRTLLDIGATALGTRCCACNELFAEMVNVLEVPSEDVAIALGHTDGGELVRRLYGHRDHERALHRVTAAYARAASLTQMRLV